MARYGRGGMHWMWQPRDLNGRFSKGGGEDMPTWATVLMVVGWFVATWWLMGWPGVVSLALAMVVLFGIVWIIRSWSR